MHARVYYHGGCPDGFTAAWAARLTLGSSAEYIPIHPNQSVDVAGCAGKHIFFLDVVGIRAELDEIAQIAEALHVIDHHKGNASNFEGAAYTSFDMNYSGAMLAWQHFHPNVEPPALVSYIQDNDLFQHVLPDWEPIKCYIETVDMNWDSWSQLDTALSQDFDVLVLEGKAIARYRNLIIDREYVAHPITIQIGDYVVPAVNSRVWRSEIGNKLAMTTPLFSCVYYQRDDGIWYYSLRSSSSGMDVSDVAKAIAGPTAGGHKHAAGFRCSNPPIVVVQR